MQFSRLLPLSAPFLALIVACGGESTASPTPTQPPPPTAPPATSTPAPVPTPELVRKDIRPARLVIPSLGIDALIQGAPTIPDRTAVPPGCPPREPGDETLVVPNQGLATPIDNLEGLENKAWIFGHSRYLSQAGIFLKLEDLNVGDELIIDGVDRATGQPFAGQRFKVEGIFLTDTESGEDLIVGEGPEDIPSKPQVILQTSVREDGAGKQWILNQQKLLGKSTNLVEGDINDPCKYLLLFVIAEAS